MEHQRWSNNENVYLQIIYSKKNAEMYQLNYSRWIIQPFLPSPLWHVVQRCFFPNKMQTAGSKPVFAPSQELWSDLQQERAWEEVWRRKPLNLSSNRRLSPRSNCDGRFISWASFTSLLLLLQQLYHLKSSVSLSFAFVSEQQVIQKAPSVPLVHHLHSGSLGSLRPTSGELVLSHRLTHRRLGRVFESCALNSHSDPQLLPWPEEPFPLACGCATGLRCACKIEVILCWYWS